MSKEQKIDVNYVAELARLRLSPEQSARMQNDLEAVIGYIAKLSEVDVACVEPTAHAVASVNVWREDKAYDSAEAREIILENAPELINDELFKVSQVLPGEGMS